MIVLPVIDREMRVQARITFTYWLRVLGAAALLGVCVYFWATHGFSLQQGPLLFGELNCALFVSIWILVPLFAADCISRERREGTLGLLFLTPLKAGEIVLSKGLVHGLRALTLLLSALPIITISYLLGGVTWKEGVLSALTNFSAICLALAAGLLASSMSKSWLRAMLLSGALAFCFAMCLFVLVSLSMIASLGSDRIFTRYFGYGNSNWDTADGWFNMIMPVGFVGVTDIEGWWGVLLGGLTGASQRNWLLAEAAVALLSFLFLIGVIRVAAWNVRRVWHEEPPSARLAKLEKLLCTPIIGVNFFRRWLRRKLERNPIGWLEQRTWSGRLVTWGWFAVMVSFYTAVFEVPNSIRMLTELQSFLGWGLILLVAVSASGSFQRERETRVLELLLVSPMTVAQIIEGRLRGLWGQFLPALTLLLVVWGYLAELFRAHGDFELIPFLCGAYLTLPVIGLHYSLSRANFFSALLSTLFVGLLVPPILEIIFRVFVQLTLWSDDYESPRRWLGAALEAALASPFFITFVQVCVALAIGRRLYHNLVRRNFAYSKTAN